MSYSSYSRLRAGIFEPTHTISAPVVSQAIDLRGLTRPARGQTVAALGGSGAGSPLANLGPITDAVLASAKGSRKSQQQSSAESARQSHQQSTLDALANQAEATAAQPSARHVYDLPQRKQTVASTRDSRGAADVWGNTVPDAADAIGPEGAFGLPTFARAPGSWAGGVFGGF